MIATIQIGNSDDKLSQREWSLYVSSIDKAITAQALTTHFFASSEGSKPWQNACWVAAVREAEVEFLFDDLKKIRKKYKQHSVAVVLGDVRMI